MQRSGTACPPSVQIVAGGLRLGLISVLIRLLKWPGWGLPALFTRGFRVAGAVELSNVYPRVAPAATSTEHALLSETEADAWNWRHDCVHHTDGESTEAAEGSGGQDKAPR